MNPLYLADNHLELSLHECGREHCLAAKEFHFTPKTYHLFHYVSAGKGTFSLAGKTYHLHRGDLFYIPPHAEPHYSPDKEDPWSYTWLGFGGVDAEGFLALAHISEKNPVYHDESGDLKNYFDEIANRYIERGHLDLKCLGYAYLLFAHLSEPGATESVPWSLKAGHLQAAKEYILNNYQFPIKIEDIAENVGVSPNYLSSLFKELENTSTKSYLTEVRMEKAKILLQSGRLKVKDVGAAVGYPNQLHFSGEFKKHFGVAPSQIQEEKK